MRVARELQEVEDLVREQVGFLRVSGLSFDEGHYAEAKRLAVSLRVLLHHRPPNSHALLEQAGALQTMSFLDTAGELDPHNLAPEHNLANIRLTVSGATYNARLAIFDRAGQLPPVLMAMRQLAGEHVPRAAGLGLPFAEWWEQPVIRDGEGSLFTRADLVKALANQDGGAHVEPTLREAYHSLSRSNSLGGFFIDGLSEQPLGTPVPASVRQIAWELEQTLHDHAPHLLPS